MKLLSSLTLVLLLTGCANLTFDSTEFDGYVTLQETVDGINCESSDVPQQIQILKKQIDHQFRYSNYRNDSRPLIASSAVEIKTMIDSLSSRYDITQRPPSVEYCKQKTKNISAGIQVLLKELGRL